MPAGLRRASAVAAIVALAVGGAKIVDDNTAPGSGFSAVATVAADPTGPPGPTGGMDGGMNGSQFQPPQMPSSMPDYQGGNNQPPLDQNNGVSIYNSGSPQAPQQVPGQQAGQQSQQGQQPAHGTQMPDYQTATPYTQGPGKANPDYQAPQQNSPQQPQQQPQQPQQPSQAPTQQQQPEKQDDNDVMRQCQNAGSTMQLAQMGIKTAGAGGALLAGMIKPGRDGGVVECEGCDQQFRSKDGQNEFNREANDSNLCPQGFQYLGAAESASTQGLFSWDTTQSWLCGQSNGPVTSQNYGPQVHATHPQQINACPIIPGGAVPSAQVGVQDTVQTTVTAQGGASLGPISGNISGSTTKGVTDVVSQNLPLNAPPGLLYELYPQYTDTPLNVVRMTRSIHSTLLGGDQITNGGPSEAVPLVVHQATGKAWAWLPAVDAAGNQIPATCP
ncbi:Hypothetical protein ERS075552_00608 [Mycobacteroides abscessus]|nr:hypothetical protein [Mycobacteroides abscessus]CPT93772.1 Hypothetical protein ERS075552_00608 [Mycobacteroides abscessus]CPW12852.1 Hypothetical protein ERS075547_01937 [Mycobacteroides abscessus]CQA07174.1 Hypothetical protein ERS075657_05057 [Mycobacteroides abscessus]SKF98582.1 Uncharacterised protein [Mycobacteroides abscessus subsp. massiliense]SKG27479.1 Uncharacterised protein [Mycobacteroides abscessus subsp. massiliense]